MLGCDPNCASLGPNFYEFGISPSEASVRDVPPSAPGHNLVAYLNTLDGNASAASDNRLVLGYANLIKPCAACVVASANVGVVGAFGVNLRSVGKQDHGPWAHLVPVSNLAPFQYAQDPSRPFHADGSCVGKGFGDDEPFGGCAGAVEGMLEDLVDDPLAAGAALTESSAGQGEAHEPVAGRRDLLRTGDPPPFAAEHLLDQVFGLCGQPRPPVFGGEQSDTILQR